MSRLDSLARAALAEERLAGLSVAVLRGRDTLLVAGYGHAELGLGVPVTPATTFRLIGPSTQALGAALLQQVEVGRLRLDGDASQLLPDFPWQGRRVTVRQLMDATSGLPDFHYLGDPHLAQMAVPKAHGDVTALVAGLPFTHEPGAQWQWTITGFHLAGGILERLSGQSWGEYLRDGIIRPAGLATAAYCDDQTVVPGLARGYVSSGAGFQHHRPESATMYRFEATLCGSALDAASFARALRDGRLLRPESWRAMVTAEGAAKDVPGDPSSSHGFGIRTSTEDGHHWVGDRGSLLGYSSAVMDFPDEDLTVVALANTSGQAAGRLARRLARAALSLPPLPPRSPRAADAAPVAVPLPAAAYAPYLGTYRLREVNPSGPYARWQRTFRVLNENGRLSIQGPGDPPEPLVYLGEHTFTLASTPAARFTFAVRGGRAETLAIVWSPTFSEAGERVSDRGTTPTPR